jgi:hypothetical protein
MTGHMLYVHHEGASDEELLKAVADAELMVLIKTEAAAHPDLWASLIARLDRLKEVQS